MSAVPQTGRGSGLWRSRISAASLRCARAASHPGHPSLGRVRSLIHFSNSPDLLVPAAHSCARVLHRCFANPSRGVGGAPRNVWVLGGTPIRPAHNAAGQALARRLASHNAGRPPLGALTVAILGSGPALPSPELLPDRSQRAPRVRVVVPGWRGPVPPGAAVMSRCRRTPRLAPPSGSSPETPLDERGWTCC